MAKRKLTQSPRRKVRPKITRKGRFYERRIGDDVPSDDSADDDFCASSNSDDQLTPYRRLKMTEGGARKSKVPSLNQQKQKICAYDRNYRTKPKCVFTSLPEDILLKNIIMPYLSQAEKLQLHGSCKYFQSVVNNPEVWTELDVSFRVIGKYVTKTGRRCQLTSLAAFELCKRIVQYPRFRLIKSANLSGLMLGVAPFPDLLHTLLKNCPNVTKLNLVNTTADKHDTWKKKDILKALSNYAGPFDLLIL